ncbi:MAG: hypothetical protein ABIH20_03540 [Candidatus Diapherotrites archaeon]
MKGVIFSTDAILAMVVIIALFSGLAISNLASNGEAPQVLLSAKATDNALIVFYTNETLSTSNNENAGPTVNCKELFEFSGTTPTVKSKVKECRAT